MKTHDDMQDVIDTATANTRKVFVKTYGAIA
jgi:hypothetical protein